MKSSEIYFGKVSSCFHLTGQDTQSFLDSQMTVRITDEVGPNLVYGLWLSDRGRILADSWVYVQDSTSCLLWSYHCPSDKMLETLQSHLVADEVQIEEVREEFWFSLKFSDDDASQFLQERPEIEECEDSIQFSKLWLNCRCDGVIASEDIHERFHQVWKENQSSSEIYDFQHPSLAIRHILAKHPRIPADCEKRATPFELNLDTYVDLRKGCFPGREFIAHLKRGGKQNKSLQQLTWSKDSSLPDVPIPIHARKLVAGQITLLAPYDDQMIGLGFMRESYMDRPLHFQNREGDPVPVELR